MITIQKASTEDIKTIQAVADTAFPATYAEILSPEQLAYMMEWMYSESALRRQILEEGHIYYIASDDGVPVGYVSIQQQEPGLFHLQKIYVLPGRQRQQIGRLLFEHAIRALKELHPAPCTLELNVNRSNKARGFYERMGMQVVREVDFPIGDGYYMNDYIMSMEV